MASLDAAPITLQVGADELAPPLTFGQMAWRRFRRHRMAMVGAVTLILLFIYAFRVRRRSIRLARIPSAATC